MTAATFKNIPKTIFLLLGVLFSLNFFPVSGQNNFFKTYDSNSNGNASSLKCTDNQDIIVGGQTSAVGAYTKSLVMRLHENGDTVWTKLLSQPSYDLRVFQLILNVDRNILVLSKADERFTANSLIHIAKLNALTGDTIWTRVTGTAGLSRVGVHSIANTSDGGIIVSATMENTGFDSNAALLRLDSSGNLLWRKSYAFNVLGSNSINAGPVKQTPDGGFIYATNALAQRGGDILLLKTDSAGDLTWSRLMGRRYTDRVTDLILTTDSNVLILGTAFSDTITHYNMFLSKVDFSGNILWANSYALLSRYGEYSTRVAETANGEYIFGGGFQHGIDTIYPVIIKTDVNGDTLWTFMSQDPTLRGTFSDVIETTDSGFISGCLQNITPGFKPLAIAKIDSNGTWNCTPQQYPFTVIPIAFTDTTHAMWQSTLLPASFPSFVTQLSSGFNTATLCPVIPSNDFLTRYQEKLFVYPTPAGESIHIHLAAFEPGTFLTVYDLDGRAMVSVPANTQDSKVNISGLSRGIYFLVAVSKKGIARQKFIKQ